MLGQDQSGLSAGESPPQGRRGKSGQILLRGGQLAPCQRQQDQLHKLGSSPSFQHEPNASRHFGSPGKGEVYFYVEKISFKSQSYSAKTDGEDFLRHLRGGTTSEKFSPPASTAFSTRNSHADFDSGRSAEDHFTPVCFINIVLQESSFLKTQKFPNSVI